MTASEMNTIKLEIIQFILNCDDESILSKFEKVLKEIKENESNNH
ncbi:hypothetical protein [Psychroflexus planctonicus]|uniref:Uncharacterized protein n=1 Tax=Psychroflexus planctonicus TaxID=1526575 RepID=A0ABQ1SIT0_9FLAO|nr:hypothetical protein [Psychroflexus planctonicus]GGE42182.1 hypothetical protein GCM10010832_22680 [Psychroflexus planctonicus]